MDWDLDQIPKSVRREPIRTRKLNGFDFAMAVVAAAAVLLTAIAVGSLLWLALSVAHARDNGQWQATDADIAQWFRELKQPDNPRMSCCGEADA